MFLCLLLSFSRLTTLSTFLSASLCFSPLIILMIFCCTHSKTPIFFLKWRNPYKILQILLWQWGSISLRRELEGNNHFFDLLLGTLLEEMFSLCCLVVVIMESPQKLWMIEGIFSSFACYKAGFVTFQQLNHFVKVTCFIKIKPWDEHWEVSKHQLLMVFW